MGLFEKRDWNSNTLDLTSGKMKELLAKREKIKDNFEESSNVDSDGMLDLSNFSGVNSQQVSNKNVDLSNSDNSNVNSFSDFFGGRFSENTIQQENKYLNQESNVMQNGINNLDHGLKIKHIESKMEDIEYKLERIIDRLDSFENKLNS